MTADTLTLSPLDALCIRLRDILPADSFTDPERSATPTEDRCPGCEDYSAEPDCRFCPNREKEEREEWQTKN